MSVGDDRPTILHVHLDEPGGGPLHVDLLSRLLGDAVRSEVLPLDPSRLRGSPAGWVRAWIRIGRRISGERVVIHAHGVRAAAAALLPARRRGVPLVITVHGLHSLRRSGGLTLRAVRVLNRMVLRSADRVLALSEADRRSLVGERLAAPGRVRRIQPAPQAHASIERRAARSTLGLPDGAQVILWLGRLADEKDPLTLVRALERLSGDGWSALVVGDGPLLPEMRSRTRDAGLEDRIQFTGWMPDPAPALSASDVFVSTSRWEGLPMAALEAGAAGLALVLSDAPGNRDVLAEGVPGLLVPAGEPEALARQVDRLLGDADLREGIGRRARAAVNSLYRPERLHRDVLAAYQELWEVAGAPRKGRRPLIESRPAGTRL